MTRDDIKDLILEIIKDIDEDADFDDVAIRPAAA